MPPAIHTSFPSNPTASPPLYLTHPIPRRPLTSVRFCPFQDILTVGHAGGLSSVLVPGAGEPHFDSGEADPFENRKARREREVKALLDKVRSAGFHSARVARRGASPQQSLTALIFRSNRI